MTDRNCENDVIPALMRLIRSWGVRFINFGLVRQQPAPRRHAFCRIDIARLAISCDLSDDLDLDAAAIGIVVSFMSKLHAARPDAVFMARAIDALLADLQSRISTEMKQA